MTSTRTSPPRRLRLGGWPAAIAAVPLLALVLSAGPAAGLGAEDVPTPDPTTTTAVVTPTPSSTSPDPTAPAADPTTAVASPSVTTSSAPEPSPTTSADVPALPVPGLSAGPSTFAKLGDPGTPPQYLPAGTAFGDLAPFQTFRLVVQLRNGGPEPVTVTPRLEFRLADTGDFQTVPEGAAPGVPIHAAEEWVATEAGSAPAPRPRPSRSVSSTSPPQTV